MLGIAVGIGVLVGSGVFVDAGVLVGSDVPVGWAVLVGAAVFVGWGVLVGLTVFVGSDVPVGWRVSVGSGVLDGATVGSSVASKDLSVVGAASVGNSSLIAAASPRDDCSSVAATDVSSRAEGMSQTVSIEMPQHNNTITPKTINAILTCPDFGFVGCCASCWSEDLSFIHFLLEFHSSGFVAACITRPVHRSINGKGAQTHCPDISIKNNTAS